MEKYERLLQAQQTSKTEPLKHDAPQIVDDVNVLTSGDKCEWTVTIGQTMLVMTHK